MLELGVQANELITWLIIYLLFCLCIVVPPQEFQSAGFTIPKIFYSYICEERFNFIEHHLRRTSLTIFIHSCLPFVYCLLLEYVLPQRIIVAKPINLIQYFAHGTILLAIAVLTYLYNIKRNDWAGHHIIKNLEKINNNQQRVMDSINSEYRSYDNLKIQYIGYSRVMVTNSWIIRISNYTVEFAQTADSIVKVVKLLSQEDSGFQLVDVEVESISKKVPSFKIRVHSQEMLDDLERKLNRRIEILNGVAITATLYERFVKAFLKQIQGNPQISYPNKEELDQCLGCSLVLSNVKISRTCDNNIDSGSGNCGECRCRPMWCGSCMARVFASKQDKDKPEAWMSGKADCPTCRSVFCVLDVCPLS